MTNEEVTIPESLFSEERDHLRKLLIEDSKETSDLERYALTLAGVIWSWCISNSHAVGIKVLFLLPIFTTLLFGLRALSVYQLRNAIRDYLEKLQQYSNVPATFGWERYAVKHGCAFRVRPPRLS